MVTEGKVSLDDGSSPRVRGKRRDRVHALREQGLIPACAGKTVHVPRCDRGRGAHPRVCGENRRARMAGVSPRGSSPRVRGKRQRRRRDPRRRRLIPACAGKTPASRRARQGRRAHPRVCGENSMRPPVAASVSGSSPRVRGKRGGGPGRTSSPGLIPACAGKTPQQGRRAAPGGAHPRVCGENAREVRDFAAQWGSSPRVRGKLSQGDIATALGRLIPACAGKTSDLRYSATHWGGSSPRVRGKRRHPPGRAHGRRLIPACAGKTSRSSEVGAAVEAHPRVCGENTPSQNDFFMYLGSSPRVRGKRAARRSTAT